MIGNLPMDVLFQVLLKLDYASLLALKRASKTHYELISKNDRFWRRKFELDFGEAAGKLDFEQEYKLAFKWKSASPKVTEFEYFGSTPRLNMSSTALILRSSSERLGVWNLDDDGTQNPNFVCKLDKFSPMTKCIDVSDALLAVGTWGGHIVVCALPSRRQAAMWLGHRGAVLDIKIHGEYVISLGEDGCVRTWHASTFRCLQTCDCARFTCFHVSHGDILCGSERPQLHAVDFTKGLKHFFDVQRPVQCLCANYRYIFGGCTHGSIEVWDRPTRTGVKTIWGDWSEALSVQCDSRTLIAGFYSGAVRIWALGNWQHLGTIEMGFGEVVSVQYWGGMIIVRSCMGILKVFAFDRKAASKVAEIESAQCPWSKGKTSMVV